MYEKQTSTIDFLFTGILSEVKKGQGQDQKMQELHLPQFIHRTPDGRLPVNGVTWRVPDPAVLSTEATQAIIAKLINDKDISFVVLQNAAALDLPASDGWQCIGVTGDSHRILYRPNNMAAQAEQKQREEKIIPKLQEWINTKKILALGITAQNTAFSILSIDIPNLTKNEEYIKDNQSALSLLTSYPNALIVGNFDEPLDIHHDHPSTAVVSADSLIQYRQTDWAIFITNDQSVVVLITESLSLTKTTGAWNYRRLSSLQEQQPCLLNLSAKVEAENLPFSAVIEYRSPGSILNKAKFILPEPTNNIHGRFQRELLHYFNIDGADRESPIFTHFKVTVTRNAIGERAIEFQFPDIVDSHPQVKLIKQRGQESKESKENNNNNITYTRYLLRDTPENQQLLLTTIPDSHRPLWLWTEKINRGLSAFLCLLALGFSMHTVGDAASKDAHLAAETPLGPWILPLAISSGLWYASARIAKINPQGSRLLSKLAMPSRFEGDAEHRAGVYTSVHEDSSTASTLKAAGRVEFGKKSSEDYYMMSPWQPRAIVACNLAAITNLFVMALYQGLASSVSHGYTDFSVGLALAALILSGILLMLFVCQWCKVTSRIKTCYEQRTCRTACQEEICGDGDSAINHAYNSF